MLVGESAHEGNIWGKGLLISKSNARNDGATGNSGAKLLGAAASAFSAGCNGGTYETHGQKVKKLTWPCKFQKIQKIQKSARNSHFRHVQPRTGA